MTAGRSHTWLKWAGYKTRGGGVDSTCFPSGSQLVLSSDCCHIQKWGLSVGRCSDIFKRSSKSGFFLCVCEISGCLYLATNFKIVKENMCRSNAVFRLHQSTGLVYVTSVSNSLGNTEWYISLSVSGIIQGRREACRPRKDRDLLPAISLTQQPSGCPEACHTPLCPMSNVE